MTGEIKELLDRLNSSLEDAITLIEQQADLIEQQQKQIQSLLSKLEQ